MPLPQDVARVLPEGSGPREGRPGTSFTTLAFVALLLAILTGSSTLNVATSGKSASLFWVDVWAVALFPLYILIARRGRVPGTRALWALIGFALAWEVLGILTTSDPLRGTRLLAIHVVGLLVYTFAAFLRFTPAEARRATRLLLFAPFIMLGMSITSFAASGTLAAAAESRAIESAVGRSNALATLFGAFIVLSLGTWVISARHRFLATAGLMASGLGLSLTGSRGGVLATLAGIAAYLWFGGRKGRRREILLLAGLALALVLGLRALGITSTVEARIAGLERTYSWKSGPIRNVFIRLDYWRVSLLMLRDSPVLGQGLGSFEHFYLREGSFAVERSTDPHNQVFLLLGETGLVGAAAAGALLLYLVRRARSGAVAGTARDWREVLFAAAVVGLAHSLVEPVFRNPSSVGLVATLLGLCANPTFIEPLAVAGANRERRVKAAPASGTALQP